MFVENGLYDTRLKTENRGMADRFVVKTLRRDEVVLDRATGLMWQQAASPQQMVYRLAMDWVDNLNKRTFAGFDDWRLPTLEEAMTLMERLPNTRGFYIDPIFMSRQRFWMWTSDRGGADSAWYVNFNYGYSQLNRKKTGHNYVCAVR